MPLELLKLGLPFLPGCLQCASRLFRSLSKGFNVETLQIDGYEFVVWDVGGRSKIRALFRHYYLGAEALMFVVDSNDRDRFEQARDELHQLLGEELLQDIPLLVLCNKQDLIHSLCPDEIRMELQIDKGVAKGRQVAVVGCSATSGLGLQEGMNELKRMLEDPYYGGKADSSGNTVETESLTEAESLTTEIDYDNELDYDPVNDNRTLELFSPIKRGTECPFAKGSKLWGAKEVISLHVDPKTSIEEQGKDIAVALEEFTRQSKNGKSLDGFCIALDSPNGDGPESLGKCIRRVLTALADEDPSGENCMRVNYIPQRGWRFRFNKADFFVTTFAPFYPNTSSRYAFGCQHAFVLLQPELSFARHDLPKDTALTNWGDPVTIRDRTRIAFRDAGRSYYIPSTTNYPMAEHIVKPLTEDDSATRVVRWWESC